MLILIKILVEQYHCTLLHQAINFRLVLQDTISDIPDQRLRPIFSFLIENGRFQEALRIATSYRFSPAAADSNALLQELMSHTNIPQLIKIKVLILLAGLHEGDKDPSLCDQYYDLAKSMLQTENHAFFALDIDLIEACRKLSPSSESTINRCLS